MINNSEGSKQNNISDGSEWKTVMKKDLSANPWVQFFIICLSLMIEFF